MDTPIKSRFEGKAVYQKHPKKGIEAKSIQLRLVETPPCDRVFHGALPECAD
jgi:hypothetical protein